MSDLNWCTNCDNAVNPYSDSLYCSEYCLRQDALAKNPLLGYDWHEFEDFPRPHPSSTTSTLSNPIQNNTLSSKNKKYASSSSLSSMHASPSTTSNISPALTATTSSTSSTSSSFRSVNLSMTPPTTTNNMKTMMHTITTKKQQQTTTTTLPSLFAFSLERT